MAQDTKECWSFNNEEYNFDSLEELMDSHGYELRPGHTVWRGTAQSPSISSLVDVESVIENIGERAYEIGGEFAEDYPDVSAEQKAKLKTLLEAWLAECPAPTFYTVKDAQAYILRAEDFSAEQLAENALNGDWGNEHDALTAYNEHIAVAADLERIAPQCLAQIQEPAAVAGPAPAGWRLVPALPTHEWIGAVADDGYWDCDCAQLIANILSHAPAAPAASAVDAMSQAARDVLAERRRQVNAEGFSHARDDQYVGGQLAGAATSYLILAAGGREDEARAFWPWCQEWLKPGSQRRYLEKVGALVLAEMERLDRAAAQAEKGCAAC